MAAAHIFQIEIHGKGGHAAFPDQAIDSVYIAAQVIQALHGIVSRHVNPFHRAVLTVSQMQASNAPNIIAETVRLGGTVRVLDSACEKILFEQMEKQVQGICRANGASCTITHDCITRCLKIPSGNADMCPMYWRRPSVMRRYIRITLCLAVRISPSICKISRMLLQSRCNADRRRRHSLSAP